MLLIASLAFVPPAVDPARCGSSAPRLTSGGLTAVHCVAVDRYPGRLHGSPAIMHNSRGCLAAAQLHSRE